MPSMRYYRRFWPSRVVEPIFKYEDHVHAELTTSPEAINLGDTVTISATFYDDDGDLEDPDSGTAKITITDPDGTAEATSQDMTEDTDEEATYYYRHNIASNDTSGLWKAVVSADMTINSETRKIVDKIYFEVEKA